MKMLFALLFALATAPINPTGLKVDAAVRIKAPECAYGTGIDANGDGVIDSGCPLADQSAAIAASGGTGRAVNLSDCKISGTMAAIADAASSGGTVVRQLASDNTFSGQFGCTISAGVGTKTLWVRAVTPTANLTKSWFAETALTVPTTTAISLFNGIQTVNYTWFKTTFTFTTTAPTLFGMLDGDVRFDCMYWDTNAAAVPDCPPETVPQITDYVMLKVNSGVTVDGSGADDDWQNANAITAYAVNGSGNACTVKMLREDLATDLIYILATCADTNLNAAATGTDNTAIFGQDGVEITIMPDTGATRGSTTSKLASNINATPSVYTANFPSDVETTAYNPSCTFVSAIVGTRDGIANDTSWTLEGVCNQGFNATAEQVGKLQVVIPNLDASFQYKVWKGNAFAANDATQFGTVLFSGTAVPAPPPDTTSPVIGSISIVSVTSTTIQVTFPCTDAGSGCAAGFVDYDTNSGVPYSFVAAGCNASGVNPNYVFTCTLLNLTANTIYFMRARANDGAGNIGVGAETNEVTSTAVACNRWAAPSASGLANGLSAGSPYQIKDFWAQAIPGRVLCLNDGTYTGTNSMIRPSDWVSNLAGTSGSPITIRAVNDGMVLINGQWGRVPVFLSNNSRFVIEGINACCSSADVVQFDNSSNNILRRFVGWDAADDNTAIIDMFFNSTFNLAEDVAGFGVGRRIFSSSQGGNDNTYRRAWGRWEGNTRGGPYIGAQFAYNNTNLLAENMIITWDQGSQPALYTVHVDGVPATGFGSGTFTGGQLPALGGLDGLYGTGGMSVPSFTRILYSIGYVKSDAVRYDPSYLFDYIGGEPHSDGCGTGVEQVTVGNVAMGVTSGSWTGKRIFNLDACVGSYGGPQGLVANSITAIGGTGVAINAAWSSSNVRTGATSASVPSIYTVLGICKRSVDGALTATPLWPWPMRQRIIDATTAAHAGGHQHQMYQGNPMSLTMLTDPHAIADVDAEVEAIFGAIPAACK